jgi:hypothetical protein
MVGSQYVYDQSYLVTVLLFFCGNKGNFLSRLFASMKSSFEHAQKTREIKMTEKLQKRISTTFKLHGFSLRRLYLLFIKHSVNYSFEFPFGINNVTKIKHAK